MKLSNNEEIIKKWVYLGTINRNKLIEEDQCQYLTVTNKRIIIASNSKNEKMLKGIKFNEINSFSIKRKKVQKNFPITLLFIIIFTFIMSISFSFIDGFEFYSYILLGLFILLGIFFVIKMFKFNKITNHFNLQIYYNKTSEFSTKLGGNFKKTKKSSIKIIVYEDVLDEIIDTLGNLLFVK